MERPTLEGEAAQWPTPMAGTPAQNGNSAAGNSDFSRKAEELARAVLWGTPRVTSGEYTRDRGRKGMERPTLEGEAAQWPTPAAQNVKGSSPDSVTRADGKSRMDILHYRAEQGFSHPAPETPRHGPTLSQLRRIWRPLRDWLIASHGRATWRRLWKGRTKRRLNPGFVEWLMGWPPGHALCDCSATEWFRYKLLMRGALSRLPTACGPWIWKPPAETQEPIQRDLFGGL